MLDFILVLSLTVIALFALKERDAVNIYIFCLFTLIFNVADRYVPDDYVAITYIAAAFNDLIIIFALSRLPYISDFTLKIQRICKLFITVNFAGWIMFMLYVPPIYYNVLTTALYLYALCSTTRIGVKNVMGIDPMDWRPYRIFSHTRSSNYTQKANQKEARN